MPHKEATNNELAFLIKASFSQLKDEVRQIKGDVSQLKIRLTGHVDDVARITQSGFDELETQLAGVGTDAHILKNDMEADGKARNGTVGKNEKEIVAKSTFLC